MPSSTRPFKQKVQEVLSALSPGTAFLVMIFGALIAFEMFNYTTTDHALQDLLGTIQFGGLAWSTLLALAFCGIDFAGIARLFTPEQGANEPAEVWYLFGAWILASGMNATLTWWGVSVAIATHTSQASTVISNSTIQNVVPIFVAIMVWVIRILIIGTFSLAGERMFGSTDKARRGYQQQAIPNRNDHRPVRPAVNTASPAAQRPILAPASSFRAQPKPAQRPESAYTRSEPTYHNLMSSRPADNYLDERS